jgi:hypothetical protein
MDYIDTEMACVISKACSESTLIIKAWIKSSLSTLIQKRAKLCIETDHNA